MTSSTSCRLCNGGTSLKFSLEVLGKYHVNYLQCEQCASLQTEAPYWLKEAYGSNLADLDTGVAQRNLSNFRAVFFTAKLFGTKNVIDFGGGDGLTCRLVRDYGINCYVSDKFAQPNYAIGFGTKTFSTRDFEQPDMLTSFEVIEHFADTRKEFAELLECGAKVVLLSTGFYKGQGPQWWYISADTGQHIFFFSKKALRAFGQEHGFHVHFLSGFTLMLKRAAPIRTFLLRVILRKEFSFIGRSLISFLKPRGVWKDYDTLRKLNR
jgi:hypothetical protein